MGRKKIDIDWKRVDKLLQAQCSGISIASLLGINEKTLYMRCRSDKNTEFTEYSAQKKGEGQELLRAKQFEMALKGNTAMVIWLGKQYLGQVDRKDLTSGDKPLGDFIYNIKIIDAGNREGS